MLDYLSPTSINTFLEKQDEFFLTYMVGVPRTPQTEAMVAGSVFDACVKAYLVVNPEGHDEYDKEAHTKHYQEYFEETVEPHLRNERWYTNGIILFNMYKETGALKHITNDAEPGTIEALGKVRRTIEVDGIKVPLLGKPDLSWVSKSQCCKIVDDWKCNGAVSPHNKSPNPGYVDIFPSRNMHKDCLLVDGVNTNDMHPAYSLQLTIYKLLTDAEIVGINQLVFKANKPGQVFGDMRVALHRHRVSDTLEENVKRAALKVWQAVTSYEEGGPFGDLSAEKCALLKNQAELFKDPVERMLSGRE